MLMSTLSVSVHWQQVTKLSYLKSSNHSKRREESKLLDVCMYLKISKENV